MEDQVADGLADRVAEVRLVSVDTRWQHSQNKHNYVDQR